MPLIEPRIYAKINFISLEKKLIILPGDQVKIRFVTAHTKQEALRLQPDIHSSSFPAPLRERYHIGNNVVRLPCDDMKVADSINCSRFEVTCAEKDDIVIFQIQGAGDMFTIEETCGNFLASQDFNWDSA